MIIRVSKLIISQPAVRGNHVVRRDLPGGDWLTVEELSGQLPGWGRNLHASFAVVLVLSGEGVFHGLDERRWELTPGMAFVHLPGVRHRVQRHRPSAWRQLVLRTSIGAWEALSVFAACPADSGSLGHGHHGPVVGSSAQPGSCRTGCRIGAELQPLPARLPSAHWDGSGHLASDPASARGDPAGGRRVAGRRRRPCDRLDGRHGTGEGASPHSTLRLAT
jgi:hypothetical protein